MAIDLIYSGRFLSGAEAAAAGLVSRVVPAAELGETAREYARASAKGPALAFAESKRLVRRDQRHVVHAWHEVLELEAAAQSRSSATRDYVEGFTAFLERREPTFIGRVARAAPEPARSQDLVGDRPDRAVRCSSSRAWDIRRMPRGGSFRSWPPGTPSSCWTTAELAAATCPRVPSAIADMAADAAAVIEAAGARCRCTWWDSQWVD